MTYDGIILGSGHNSLVLQAYLGRAGLRVLCLERRHVAGFVHNTHSFYTGGSIGRRGIAISRRTSRHRSLPEQRIDLLQ
jgi:ribulose 1,5-bisphosphate synthetase/thiazole synthase